VTVPEASFFSQFSDLIVQAFLFEDQLTDFAGFKPLVLDVEMFQGRNNAGKISIAPLKVQDLDQEIQIRLPNVSDRTLTCAYFNEEISSWESLKCDNEIMAQDTVTCCTTHLTRFALVPAEYLEVVDGVQQKNGIPDGTVEIAESGRGINWKYLVGCIAAFLTLVGTLFCLGKQIFAFKTEKKRYEQLVRENNNQPGSVTAEGVMPTERHLMTNDD